MKKVLLAALVMVGTVTFAQRKNGYHQGRQTNSADRMKQELSLTDDQFSKVKAMNEKYASHYSAVRNDTSLTRGRATGKMNQLMAEQQAELKKILTTEQWAKLTGGNRKNRPGISADRMKQQLSLTDEQYHKVKAISEKYSSKYSTVQKEQEAELKKVLTPEQWAKWTDTSNKVDRRGHHRGGHRGRQHHG